MARIEILREKLYFAIKQGDAQQILAASQELDCEIVQFMKLTMNNK